MHAARDRVHLRVSTLPEARIAPSGVREHAVVTASRAVRAGYAASIAIGRVARVVLQVAAIFAIPILLVLLAARAVTAPQPHHYNDRALQQQLQKELPPITSTR
jgi:hypothetical protein